MSLPLYRPLETVSLDNAIEDLVVRFILNVPPEDLATVERVLFHFEEASWFYTDFVKLMNPYLPNLSIRSFSKTVKDICPLIWNWDITPENALVKFSMYKRSIPVRGAAIFNENLSKILLLRGANSKHWSFPRGKIGKDEDDVSCCIREVKEETGFDLTGYIDADQYVERNMNGKNFKIFLVKGVPEDFEFKPEHKNEIQAIEWKDFKKLSKAIFKNEGSAKVFLVNSMIRPLSLYVKNEKRAKDEDKLKQYAEEHLKAILGLNKKENKIVLDAGRELMEMLQSSAKNAQHTSVGEQQPATESRTVDVNQARNLFPLISVQSLSTLGTTEDFSHSSSELNGHLKSSPNNVNVSNNTSTQAQPGDLQASSKELLAFLHKASTVEEIEHNDKETDTISSFPTANINSKDENYEEFESSSDESEYEDSQEVIDNANIEFDAKRNDENLLNVNKVQTETPQQEIVKPTATTIASSGKPKMTILKRLDSQSKPNGQESQFVTAQKPKIRLLKRGDKLEDLSSGGLSPKSQSVDRNSSSPAPVSLDTAPKTEPEYQSDNFNQDSAARSLLSILKKPSAKEKEDVTSSSPRFNNITENNEEHKVASSTASPVIQSENGTTKNIIHSLSESQQGSVSSPNNGSSELLDLLKKPQLTENFAHSPVSESSETNTKPSSELLSLLKKPKSTTATASPTVNESVPAQTPYQMNQMNQMNPMNQGYQTQPQISHQAPQMQQMMPPQNYMPQNMPFVPQMFPGQQQYVFQQPMNGYPIQNQPPMNPGQNMNGQTFNQSQELLNMLQKPNQNVNSNPASPLPMQQEPQSASSELLSLLRR